VDSISLAKPASIVDNQLPSLLSLVIDGLPPLQQSKYVHEAEKRLHQYVEHHHNVYALDSCCRAGLSSAGYMHPGVISVDRLVEISFSYALMFLLDDLFLDTPNEFHQDQYGVSLSSCGSPQKIQEYLEHLDGVYSQQIQPSNPTPLIETLMWESGQKMLELSNPEGFGHYVTKIVEHHRGSVASYVDILQGRNLYFKDLESYAIMRVRNIGANFVQLAVEFANDSYIPGILRTTPYFENVTTTTAIHLAFVNDVFSYNKESSFEQNPRNLITVLLEIEGKPFVETVHMAIGLLNTYACVVIDLEAKAWNSTLQNHLEDLKALMAGNIYYSFIDKRYRHPDSTFPELRDMTSTWKIIPHAKGPCL